mgnify:CR=1 FL=1|jgi:hypothetical protein
MVLVVSGIPVEYKQQENDVSSQTDSNNFEQIYLEERISQEGIFCCIITCPFIFPFNLMGLFWRDYYVFGKKI